MAAVSALTAGGARWLALASSIACTTAYTAAAQTRMLSTSGSESVSESSKDDLWYVGVLLEVVTSFLGNFGKILWRLAALVAPGALSNAARSRRAISLYVLGFLLGVIEFPLDGFAFTFAPYSIMGACAGLGIVWNVVLAPCVLGEQLTVVRLSAAAGIVIGTFLTGVFGPHEEVRASDAPKSVARMRCSDHACRLARDAVAGTRRCC
jgi:hypothetical protein